MVERDDALARRAALEVGHHVLVQAPAGSGKTGLLVQRALACLAQADNPEEVLLVTFTVKAANEIRQRLLESIADAELPTDDAHVRQTRALARVVAQRDHSRSWGLLENPVRLRAMTIDALNGLLAKSAPVLSGLSSSGHVDDQPAQLYREAALGLYASLEQLDSADPLRNALQRALRFGSNRLEKLLPFFQQMLAKREQWLAQVTALQSEPEKWEQRTHAFVAGLVAQRRAALLGHLGEHTDALAAAAQAAGIVAGATWPDASDPAADKDWQSLCGLLLTQSGGLRKKLDKRNGFPAKVEYTVAANTVLRALNGLSPAAIELLVQAAVDVQRLPAGMDLAEIIAQNSAISRVLLHLSAHLQLAFQKAAAVDFSEVAGRALSALGDAEGHTPLLERLDYAIRHILVDEAQDTSTSQYRLLAALTAGWEPQDGRSLFMVGDPQQSIYSFRQADVRLFLNLWNTGQFNDLPLRRLQLSKNFRSTPAVVAWVNDVFRGVFPTDAEAEADAVSYAPSHAARSDTGQVVEHWFAGSPAAEEAEAVLAAVRRALSESPDGSIAILVRARSHVRDITAALSAADIDYACQDIHPLADTDPVRDVVALIRALWHPYDRVAWGTLLRAPFVGLSFSDLAAVTYGRTRGSFPDAINCALAEQRLSTEGRQRLQRLCDALADLQQDRGLAFHLGDAAEFLWHRLGGAACINTAQGEDVRHTFALLREHLQAGRLTDLEAFERGLTELYAAPGTGRVQILTVHKAKGLEFDTVILPGLWRRTRGDDRDLLAYRHTGGGAVVVAAPGPTASPGHSGLYETLQSLVQRAQQNELRRLLYVAATRARNTLHLMLCVKSVEKPQPSASTPMTLLWPVLEARYADAAVVVAQAVVRDATPFQPLAPRLPLQWQAPAETERYQPPASRTLMPSELVVREDIEVEGRDHSVVERIVGILYHEIVADLCDRGAQHSPDWSQRYRAALAARMRRLGMPEPRLADSADKVLALVQQTLDSDDGRWVTTARQDAHNEYRIAGYEGGQWVSAVVDRMFVDDDGSLVVVDYKTGGAGLLGQAAEDYMAARCRSYAPQIREYARLLRAQSDLRIRAGLYFPEFSRWAETPLTP